MANFIVRWEGSTMIEADTEEEAIATVKDDIDTIIGNTDSWYAEEDD